MPKDYPAIKVINAPQQNH